LAFDGLTGLVLRFLLFETSVQKLKDKAVDDDKQLKKTEYDQGTFKPSHGYGGKYGVQNDRIDKVCWSVAVRVRIYLIVALDGLVGR
jgi:hypothetical protein